MRRARLRPIDWSDDRPTVSTNRAAGLLGVGWERAFALMKSGELPSVRIGVKSQDYLRTSFKAIAEYQSRLEPTGPPRE